MVCAVEKLDVFHAAPSRAASYAGAPVWVFIHGGYWRSLGKSDHSFLAPALTAAGACMVVPNYDLCPAVSIPEITLQMVIALAWTYRQDRTIFAARAAHPAQAAGRC